MRYVASMALVVVSLIALTTRADDEKRPFKPGKADVRGKVTQVTESPAGRPTLGKVLIEGAKEADTQHDKASVTVTKDTTIERVVQGERKPAKFADLKKGVKVQADFTGPSNLSYPVMARAKSILILE